MEKLSAFAKITEGCTLPVIMLAARSIVMGLENAFWKDLGPNVSATMKSRPETQIIHSVITHVDILNVNHSEFVLLKRMVQLVVSVGMDL